MIVAGKIRCFSCRMAVIIVLLASVFCGFAAAQSSVHSSNGVRVVSPRERKAELRSVLDSREFSRSELSWLDKLSSRMGRAMRRTLERMQFSPKINVPDSLYKFIGVMIIIVVIAGIIFFVVYRLNGSNSAVARNGTKNSLYDGPSNAAAAMDQAAGFASEGDFRAAIRLVYLAALLKLDEKSYIRFDKTGTNWEYLSKLRSTQHLYSAMRPVTMTFDRKWYGHEHTSESDYRDFLNAFESVSSYGAAK